MSCNCTNLIEIDRDWNYHPRWGMKYTVYFGRLTCGYVINDKGGE